jgi:hypothetical protein
MAVTGILRPDFDALKRQTIIIMRHCEMNNASSAAGCRRAGGPTGHG